MIAGTCRNRGLSERVQWTGADVAIDNTDTPQYQPQKPRRRIIAYGAGAVVWFALSLMEHAVSALKPGLISLRRAWEYGTNGAN